MTCHLPFFSTFWSSVCHSWSLCLLFTPCEHQVSVLHLIWPLLSMKSIFILVCSGCRNKIPQTRCLHNRNFVSCRSGPEPSPRPECPHRQVRVSALFLACGWPPYCCVLTWPSMRERRRRRREGQLSLVSLPIKGLILLDQGPTLYNLSKP